MVRNILSATVVAASLLSTTSLAWTADIQAAPVAATGPNWTGFYLGVHGGGAFGNVDYGNEFVDPGTEYHLADNVLVYGIHGGFDYQVSNSWVAGIELAATRLDSDIAAFIHDIPAFYADWNLSAAGRLGYLVTPDTLFYGRLGYSALRVKAIEGSDGMARGTVSAALIGFGAETFVSNNITARIDANYTLPSGNFVTADDEFFDPRYLLVTAGLSYRFGAGNGSAHASQVAREMDWNGFYGGVGGSYNLGVMDLNVSTAFATVGPFGAQTAGASVFAGYDFVIGTSYVLGIEAEATYLNMRFEDPSQNSGDPTAPTRFGTVKAALSLTARAGYIATPSTLIYAKGGFAGLLTEANDDFFALDGGGSKMLSAYQVGAGIETAVTENVSLRVEGLYTKAIDDLVVTNSQLDQNALKPSLLTGKIGLAYRF